MKRGRRTTSAIRAAVLLVVLVVLAVPTAAVANPFFRGPVGGGANNAGVEFRARIHNGHPRKVLDFRWFNVPVPPNCADSYGGGQFSMKVNHRRRFHGTFSVPNTNHKAIVHGRFKRGAKKATGTLELKGSFAGGCSNTDTGSLQWTAKRGG